MYSIHWRPWHWCRGDSAASGCCPGRSLSTKSEFSEATGGLLRILKIMPHAVPAAGVHAMDCGASAGTRAALVGAQSSFDGDPSRPQQSQTPVGSYGERVDIEVRGHVVARFHDW